MSNPTPQLTGTPAIDALLQSYITSEEPHAHGRLYRGISAGADAETVGRRLPAIWVEQHAWADGRLRMVWIAFAPHAMLTYCEGDIDLFVASDEYAFDLELDRCAGFYGVSCARSPQ